MRSPLLSLALEARNVANALREERTVSHIGPVVVSGMLAQQLAKELSADAAPGAVVVADDPDAPGAPVAIRIVAGHPTDEDDSFVRRAERAEVPVVIVQLWPQESWREPFVLSPFVVECKAGEGFPVTAIAKLLTIAADDPTSLAARLPILKETVERSAKRQSLARAAFVGATLGGKGAARPVLVLEQIGLVGRMRALEDPEADRAEQLPVLAATAGATIAAGYAFRTLARRLRGPLPTRLSDAAVAAAGTWVLAEVFRRLEARNVL